MLKDNYSSGSISASYESPEEMVEAILAFVGEQLNSFKVYYIAQQKPLLENRISDLLVHHLMSNCSGFEPYYFSKNPSQAIGTRETDIGAFVKGLSMVPLQPILEFEAKRLSSAANNQEYVFGERGGIERFKRKIHASNVSVCAMIGYVLEQKPHAWLQAINVWISTLGQTSTINGLDWSGQSEQLDSKYVTTSVVYAKSVNRRIDSTYITINHYLVDLT